MKPVLQCLLVSIVFLALSGCQPQSLYRWNNYDTKLYKHYKDPAESEEFIVALKETLDDAETTGRVPPGIYAEYGFALFEQGNNQAAISYYRKEADKWPESRSFMDKLISVAQNRSQKQDEKTTSPAIQETAIKQAMPTPSEVPQ